MGLMATISLPGALPPLSQNLDARAAIECTPRRGIANLFERIRTGKEIRVAYLGGSITAQPGWRVKSLDYFKKTYPQCKFTETNAAIGGTGSDLGVLRLEHDVFSPAPPDLLFVEFAVNDSTAKPVEIVRAMEGIVRKTWKTFPKCDICFVYTFTDKQLEELKTGILNRSAATMEMVADHYGIPSIHLGLGAVRLEKEGKLLMKAPEVKVDRVSGDELNQVSSIPVGSDGKIAFSNDGVHPYLNTGHQLYAEAIMRSMPKIRAASIARTTLPSPLDQNNYEKSTMISPSEVKLDGPWMKLTQEDQVTKPYLNRVPGFWRGETGATLSFKFKGSAVAFYDLLGPQGPNLEISVDGRQIQVKRIDGYCTYWRLGLVRAALNLNPEQIHEVIVKVLPDTLNRREILFERNRDFFDKNQALYRGNNWYLGSVFIIGETKL